MRHFVTKRDGKGFVIKLNKKASLDIPFSWYAIGVKDAAMFRSKPSSALQATPSGQAPTPSPAPPATIEPSLTSSPEASPSAQ